MSDRLLKSHAFIFNEHDNGGEWLTLDTQIYAHDDEAYYNQSLTLHSYSNSATFSLLGACLTPKVLRRLADELEEAEREGMELRLEEYTSQLSDLFSASHPGYSWFGGVSSGRESDKPVIFVHVKGACIPDIPLFQKPYCGFKVVPKLCAD